jgi:hypothetical protein
METFQAFFDSLKLSCEEGNPDILNWTVAEETPDLVYYQVNIFFRFLLSPNPAQISLRTR